jgi:hypothetical protein
VNQLGHTERQLLRPIEVLLGKRFYVAQPFFVARKDDRAETWELIDGQQWLATIFINLQALRSRRVETNCFEIEYQTRPGSLDFLRGIGSVDIGPDCERWLLSGIACTLTMPP